MLGRDRLVKKKAPTPIQPSSPPVEEASDESEADDSDDEDDDEEVTTKGLLEDINRALQQHIRRQDKKIRNLERKVDYLIGILTQPSDPIPPGVNLKSWNTWAEAVKKSRPQQQDKRQRQATDTPTIPLPIGTQAKRRFPEPKPDITKAQRRIVVLREKQENDTFNPATIRDAINNTLIQEKAPASLKVSSATLNPRGNVIVLTKDDCTSDQVLKYKDQIEKAVKTSDPHVKSIQSSEHWTKILVHSVSLDIFPDNPQGLSKLREEIETYNSKIQLAIQPRYLTRPDRREGKEKSSVVIAIREEPAAEYALRHGVMVMGSQLKTSKYLSARPYDQCTNCQGFGHHWQRCTQKTPTCKLCAGPHASSKHKCKTCEKEGKACHHTLYCCTHCSGIHAATDPKCEYIKAIHIKYNVRFTGADNMDTSS